MSYNSNAFKIMIFFHILNQVLNANNANNLNKNIVDCFAFFISIKNDTKLFIILLKYWIKFVYMFQKSSSSDFNFWFNECSDEQKTMIVIVSNNRYKKSYIETIANVRFCNQINHAIVKNRKNWSSIVIKEKTFSFSKSIESKLIKTHWKLRYSVLKKSVQCTSIMIFNDESFFKMRRQ